MKQILVPAAVLSWTFHGLAWADGRFERAAVHLEQTVEDEDIEIAFEAVSGTAGLKTLQVVAPDSRTVVDFRAADAKLGMRQIVVESPEPKNDGSLQADFPAGSYTFTGTLTSGTILRGEATLSQKFPGTAHITQPRAGDRNVPTTGLQVRWNAVRDAASYVVVIEQEKTGREIKADLGSTATAFTVADGFLLPGLEYKLAVGAVGKDGNRTVTEVAFVTAGRK